MFKKDGGETQLITIKYYNEHGNGEINLNVSNFVFYHTIKDFKILEKTIRISNEPYKVAGEIIEELERVKRLNAEKWCTETFYALKYSTKERAKMKEKFDKKADRFISMVKKYV